MKSVCPGDWVKISAWTFFCLIVITWVGFLFRFLRWVLT